MRNKGWRRNFFHFIMQWKRTKLYRLLIPCEKTINTGRKRKKQEEEGKKQEKERERKQEARRNNKV